MSYSRWSNSNWYSFWNTSSKDKKEDEILSLWYSLDEKPNFSYSELIEIKTINDLRCYFKEDIDDIYLTEAMEYIQMFIDDVNDEFEINDEEKI
jgi:hypothetical protein